MQASPYTRLLDPKEAATVLRISKPKLYKLSSDGLIRKIKIGSSLRFRIQDLEEFIESCAVDKISR